jgi:hypothetical protein
MSEHYYVGTFVQSVQLTLHAIDKAAASRVHALLNEHHTGHGLVPLDAPVSDAHKAATHLLGMGSTIRIVVGVHPNGDMEMVGLYTDAHCRSCGIEPAAGDARMCGECSAFQRYGLGGGWVPA